MIQILKKHIIVAILENNPKVLRTEPVFIESLN
jgi:hypothetical protein